MRTTKPPTLEKPPTCPRCGDDLTGTIAAWADHCPLEGTCSECGLHLHWSDVLVGQRALPNWHAENPKGRPFLTRLFRTVFCTLWPSRFWSVTQLEHTIHESALRVYLRVALVLVAFASALSKFVAGVFGSNSVSAVLTAVRSGDFSMIYEPDRALVDALAPLRAWSFAGAYALLHANVLEWFNLELFPLLALLTIALVPFTYRLIPATLGARKVRPAHIWRAAAYGFIPTLILLECFIVLVLLFRWSVYGAPDLSRGLVRSGLAPLALAALWQTLWWWQVNARYLRIPRPGLVAVGMVLIAVLLAGLSVFATPLGSDIMLQLV